VCAMCSPSGRARRARHELGFTLLELVVAILLVDVAILAVLHTHAVVVRNRNEMRARSAAVDAATARVEQIIASPCVAAAGSTLIPSSAEFWSSSVDATTREISDSMVFGVSARHTFVLRTRSSC